MLAPFAFGPCECRRVTVKIMDDGEIENLEVIELDADGRVSPPSDSASRRIEDRLAELGKQVPKGEWKRVPGDLIDRLDYYTAGADV